MVRGMEEESPRASVAVELDERAGDATYTFRVEVENYGDLRVSLATVAPIDVRVVVVGAYVAALCALTYGMLAGARWPLTFAAMCFAAGCCVETWVWKHIARRYALTAFTMARDQLEDDRSLS